MPETTTLRGNLSVQNGQIALQDGGTVYYVRGLDHLIGFVEGLREGAAVILEGYSFEPPPAGFRRTGDTAGPGAGSAATAAGKLFVAQKLTLNGKEYDNLTPHFAQGDPGMMGFPGMMGNSPRGQDRGQGRDRDNRSRRGQGGCR
jgi:hypothetical protein